MVPPSNFLLLGLKDIVWLHLKGYRVRGAEGLGASEMGYRVRALLQSG